MKAGGDSPRRLRMCSTNGRCVAEPCDTRVRRADLRRTGGTDHHKQARSLIRSTISGAAGEHSRLEMRTSSIMFLQPRHPALAFGFRART